MLPAFGMERPEPSPDSALSLPPEGGLETSLLAAILTPGRLSVVFQPIFDVSSREPRMYGVEALIRGPRGTNAEKPSVLFEYVRRRHEEAATDRACVAAVFAETALLPYQPRMSVNVHASTLGRDDGFARFVADSAEANNLSSREIVVEIVEHAPPFDVPGFRRSLKELREAGFSIALDDIGLGQSNFRMVLDVRPEVYKLDRYLVDGAYSDPYRQVLLDTLGRMVNRLGARAVAEGVEDPRDLGAIHAAEIHLVQGFYFSHPLTRADLLASGYLDGASPRLKPAPTTDGRPHSPRLRAPRLLVVDDDESVVCLIQTYFETLDWAVVTALDASAARATLDAEPFDVALVDLNLSRHHSAEGLEVIDAIHKAQPKTACLLITGMATGSIKDEAKRRGAHGIVRKPFSLVDLEKAALEALGLGY